MMLIACLARRLHADVDYATFRRAWIPDEIPRCMERIAPVEKRRHERIKHLAGEPTLNAVYQVVGDDDLSRPIPA